jgi:lipid II:glycine glycyltransferase (peptidoglycan interpeptide bridge formation enzyme)
MIDPADDRIHRQRSPQEIDWDRFLESLPEGDFMQTSWWAKFMEERDWGYFGVMVNHGETILGGARVLCKFYRPGHCYYYIPEGPSLPAYPAVGAQVFQYLMNYVEQMRQQEDATVSHLRIEPRWSVLPDYITGFQAAKDWMEPRRTRCIDLTQSEDTLLAQMKPKGRYNIGLAQRHGVQVVEDVSPTGRADFLRLYHETVTRQNLKAKSSAYFDSLLTTLTEFQHGTLFFAEYAGVRLATALIVCFGSRVTYFFGGSTEQHRQVMAPYLLHYEIMRWAKARGCACYDLYGIAPPERPEHRWAGFSAFKRKLGGQDIQFVPALDYVYDAEAYAEFKRKS